MFNAIKGSSMSLFTRWRWLFLLAAMAAIAVPGVSYAQDAKAVDALTNAVMKEIEKKFRDVVAAEESVSAAAKGDIVKKLAGMARPIVKKNFTEGMASGKMPNPVELAQAVQKEVLPRVPELVEAAKAEEAAKAAEDVAKAEEAAKAAEAAKEAAAAKAAEEAAKAEAERAAAEAAASGAAAATEEVEYTTPAQMSTSAEEGRGAGGVEGEQSPSPLPYELPPPRAREISARQPDEPPPARQSQEPPPRISEPEPPREPPAPAPGPARKEEIAAASERKPQNGFTLGYGRSGDAGIFQVGGVHNRPIDESDASFVAEVNFWLGEWQNKASGPLYNDEKVSFYGANVPLLCRYEKSAFFAEAGLFADFLSGKDEATSKDAWLINAGAVLGGGVAFANGANGDIQCFYRFSYGAAYYSHVAGIRYLF